MQRDPITLRCCHALVRLFSAVVPPHAREDWRREWQAELRHRYGALDPGHRREWRIQMDLLRRALGALPDAAWLRRQFTADAEIAQDLRHGMRMLRKSPGFVIPAVFILALGLGGTVSIATLLNTLLFQPLPYADADRVVTVWQQPTERPAEREDVSPANFIDWRERSRSFESMAAVIPYSFDYTGGGDPEVFFGAQVTTGFFDAIGTKPAIGRAFLPDEHVKGARRVVIISHGLWQRRFGSDPAIVNRVISMDGDPWTIVGVLPREFAPQLMPRPGELGVWAPKTIQDHEKRTRGSAWWNVVARLKPGVTREQAQAEMDTISAALAREYPGTNERITAAVVPLREHLMGDVRLPLFVMLGAVVLVLVIGCANVASLLLARGIQREREFAIRSALGAGRARLVRQMVVESLMLAALSAVAGVALAYWGVNAIVALAPAGVLRLHDAAIDSRILMFAAALTAVTALAFGLLPALQFSRPEQDAMRERQGGAPRRRVRRGLVAAEVALALVLLTGAGLLIRSFGRLLAVDPGFSPKNVVALQVFAWDRHGSPDRTRVFFNTTIDRLRTLPGVESVGAVSAMPFITANIDIKSPIAVVGRPQASEREQRGGYVTIATPDYFRTMSIPLREGRFLEETDREGAAPVAVVTDTLKRREWPAQSPVGQRIRIQWQGQPREVEIVGVVGQVRHDGLDSAPRAEVYVPHAQVPFASMTYVMRAQGDPANLIQAAKREVWAVDPLQTFYDTVTVEGLVDASVVRQRFSTTLLTAFALIALILCATGIYGVISFTTAQRTREIGVRMALGASASEIRGMVLREGGALIAMGVVLGLAGAFAGARFMQSLLFEVGPGDPLTLGAVSVLLAGVGLAACYMPARRATRVDPLVALRVE